MHGGAGRAAPQGVEHRLHAIEELEVLGDEAELEVALVVALHAEAGAGEVGRAEVEPGAVDDDGLHVHARALLHLQAAFDQRGVAIEGGAEAARGQLGVEQAQLDAAGVQVGEGVDDGADAAAAEAGALDEQLLDVGGGDPDALFGAGDAAGDDLVVERAAGDELAAEGGGERLVEEIETARATDACHDTRLARAVERRKKSMCYVLETCAWRSTAAASIRRTWRISWP